MRCLINGIKAEYIDVMDRGLHYGDGLFETLLVSDGKLMFWDRHMTRLQNDAERLKIKFPGEVRFLDDIKKLLKYSNDQHQVLKLMLTRGSSERGYAIPERAQPLRITMISDYAMPVAFISGVHTKLCHQTVSINRGLAGIKHLNRLENVLARDELGKAFQEGLMLDDAGFVIEGTMSNLFMVKDEVLYTPDLSASGVDGVIRDVVITIAEKKNIAVEIIQMTTKELSAADEVFICNSIIGISPVIRIDTTEFETGKLCLYLRHLLKRKSETDAKFLD